MYTWRDWRDILDIAELENLREMTGYAIQSQYAASARILALAAACQEEVCPEADVGLFFRTMFDIYTAEGVGLDNWGMILQMGRVIPGPYLGPCFGFDGSELHPFSRYPFAPDTASEDGAVALRLDDEAYRLLLLYKAMANISASTAQAQNDLLAALVGTGIADLPGAAYVLEVDTMVIRWVFEDSLDAIQLAVFRVAGALARGAGVGWELYALNPGAVFGFDGGNWQPFNQAPFAPDGALINNRKET
ncbi:DUF2612 domain-containing protein [Desulfovibrio sp. OttesenSCG-928-A18]|nr:DUF2612 domain-containing protein [Desulfovibrio sp. OttesenSCG-928-A18]